MIPDLKYPEDARKALDALLHGLAYDSAIAVAGLALSKILLPAGTPDFAVPIRCSGLEEDQAVRRDAPLLLSRFSLISLVSRFEIYAQHLLLQRRVLEFLGGPGKKMDSKNLWRILAQVVRESKQGPVKMCDGLVIAKASPALKEKMAWLEGLYRVRNCLAHRLGVVQMIDVKPPGATLDQTKDDDILKAIWLRPRFLVDGQEVALPYSTTKESKGRVEFVQYVRTWKIGDHIDVDPAECESIAITFQLLGKQVQCDFEREMNELLGLSVIAKT
jgi:hypothetical protein